MSNLGTYFYAQQLLNQARTASLLAMKFGPHEPFVGPHPLDDPDECPCCGAHATLLYWPTTDRCVALACVECDACGLQTRAEWDDGCRGRALRVWNRRVDPNY